MDLVPINNIGPNPNDEERDKRVAAFLSLVGTETKLKEFTVTKKGKKMSLTPEKVTTLVKEPATEVGLKFTKPTDPDSEWYGTAALYLNFFLAFQLRLQELRAEDSNMPINKESGASKVFPVKYGFNESHHIILEGCTFPPEKRSAMAQSLEPATTILCYIKSEPRFK